MKTEQKKKIHGQKIGKMFLNKFQNIAHLSAQEKKQFCYFLGGGGVSADRSLGNIRDVVDTGTRYQSRYWEIPKRFYLSYRS